MIINVEESFFEWIEYDESASSGKIKNNRLIAGFGGIERWYL